MSKALVTRRNKLNNKQIRILSLICKFRFITSDLLARINKVTRTSINYSLDVLRDQGLIDRKYNSSFKLQGKSAIYYLTPKGVKLVKEALERDKKYSVNDKVIKYNYKNKLVSDEFIDLCLSIVEVFLALRGMYPIEEFNIFSRAELTNFNYFPQPSPGLYLSRRNTRSTKPSYMLDVINDNRLFVYKQRLRIYIDHEYSGDWAEGRDYPIVLLVCPDTKMEKKLQRYLYEWYEDVKVYTCTMGRLLNSGPNELKIWINPEDEYEDKETELVGL